MFKTTPIENRIKTLKRDDHGFYIKDKFRIIPRAGFEISQQCPREYKMIMSECIDRGWLLPVAYVKESEHIWEQLGS